MKPKETNKILKEYLVYINEFVDPILLTSTILVGVGLGAIVGLITGLLRGSENLSKIFSVVKCKIYNKDSLKYKKCMTRAAIKIINISLSQLHKKLNECSKTSNPKQCVESIKKNINILQTARNNAEKKL